MVQVQMTFHQLLIDSPIPALHQGAHKGEQTVKFPVFLRGVTGQLFEQLIDNKGHFVPSEEVHYLLIAQYQRTE
jgi:hypothetical protein